MSNPFRSLGGNVVVVAVFGVLAAGCSDGSTGTQAADAPIGVQTSQMFVTVENRAGLPLLDINVAIVPVGRSTEFKVFQGRMENSEKRDFPLGDFSGRDGTPFSMRVVKPRSVKVTAKDMNNKTYEVEVPWQ
jgi:hypothetical protein